MLSKPRIVLDTNVFLVSISPRSQYHWIFQAILTEQIELLIRNEILMESEEVIGQKISTEAARNTIRALLVLPNASRLEPDYRWSLTQADPDDDKFVDCAVAGNAHALVPGNAYQEKRCQALVLGCGKPQLG